MANKHRGEVSIKLDKMRKLRLDFNAFAELEEIHGVSMDDIEEIAKKHPVSTMRKIIHVALLHEMPDLTLREAGDLISQYSSIEEIAEKMKEAMEASFGTNKPQKNAKSGPSGAGKH
jgi:hypothetical protein